MERLDIDNIRNVDKLNSELEYEKALSVYGRLRWMAKENNGLVPVKQYLKRLIKEYEERFWKDEDKISDGQIRESDIAERIIAWENAFIQKRKELIKEKLKENGLTQKDLAKILGHRPNYMSELMNGVRPFSRDDIIVLHRLFDIDLKDLMPPFLKPETRNHIKRALKELRNGKSKLNLTLIDPEVI